MTCRNHLTRGAWARFAQLALLCAGAAPLLSFAAGVVGNDTAASCTEAALNAALAGGGLVTFRCGPEPVTIPITSTKVIAQNTQVKGGGLVTLDGLNAVRLFDVPAGMTLGLADITLARGRAAGAFNPPGNTFGGAVRITSGNLAADHVTFDHNTSTGPGGAIQATACEEFGPDCPRPVVSIIASSFLGNAAQGHIGGAIQVGDTLLSIVESTFSVNHSIYGGAVAIYSNSDVTIDRSTFNNNFTSGSNFSQGHGGAIAIENANSLQIARSTFFGNEVQPTEGQPAPRGGAIYFFSPPVGTVLNHVTITGNRAFGPGAGAGIYVNEPNVTVRNSIIAQNEDNNCAGTLGGIDGGHNLQFPETTCTGFTVADPMFVDVLGPNGGPTQTVPISTLSPAIGAADPATSLPTDQRGIPVPQFGSPDIGAYEVLPYLTPGRAQGLFWNKPPGSEAGRGFNFTHQGDIIFVTAFVYDTDGNPLWFAAEAHLVQPGVYAGTVFLTSGPSYDAVPWDPALVTETQVGFATLAFVDADNVILSYAVGGFARSKRLTRQLFAEPVPVCTWNALADLTLATNYQDLWWAFPPASQAGWGANFTHQGDIIFVTWFTYAKDGGPSWLIAVAEKTADRVYSGQILRVTGPRSTEEPFDPSQVVETVVGNLTITFADGNHATFAYTVDGVSQTKSITRQVFAGSGTVCQ